MKSLESVAIATVRNFEMSISNSDAQYGTVIDFYFGFLGLKLNKYFLFIKDISRNKVKTYK
jgi:hypothetical protein